MTWNEFWGGFDKAKYANSIKHLKEHELRREHDVIRKKVVSARAAAVASGAALIHTVGFSAIGAGMSYRKQRYNVQKQNIIEDRMNREGWLIPDMRKRDFLMAVGPSAVTGALVPGAEHFISHAAGHGASAFTASHASATFSAVAHDPSTFAHAMADGASAQLHAVSQGLAGHATQLVSIDSVASNTPSFLGYVAGQGAANSVEIGVVNWAVNTIANLNRHQMRGYLEMMRGARSTKPVGRPNKQVLRTAPRDPRGAITHTTIQDSKIPPAADVDLFLFFLLPAVINAMAGVRALQIGTLLAIIWDLFASDRTKLLSTWTCLSVPAIIASTLGTDALWRATSCLEFILVIKARVARPRILACVAIPLWCCTTGTVQSLFFGFIMASLSIDLIQFNLTSNKRDKNSLTLLSWRSLKRPEYVASVALAMSYGSYSNPGLCYIWLGCFIASLLISVLQTIGRRC